MLGFGPFYVSCAHLKTSHTTHILLPRFGFQESLSRRLRSDAAANASCLEWPGMAEGMEDGDRSVEVRIRTLGAWVGRGCMCMGASKGPEILSTAHFGCSMGAVASWQLPAHAVTQALST